MATENQINIVGNLTEDPELRYTPKGLAVVNFRVAVNRRIKDEVTGQWKDGDASYFTVNAWRGLAENIADSLARGTRVVVVGSLRMRSYETRDGEKRTVYEIEADEVARLQKNEEDQVRIVRETTERKVQSMLVGRTSTVRAPRGRGVALLRVRGEVVDVGVTTTRQQHGMGRVGFQRTGEQVAANNAAGHPIHRDQLQHVAPGK